MMYYKILALLMALIHQNNCVEVHFEAADSGFFLKHSRQPPVTPEISNSQSSPPPPFRVKPAFDSILSVDRFTIVQNTQPVSIRASYGPFSTKQTVPARYIVPDAIENQNEYLNNTTAALIELQQSNMHLDISAHLVRPSVTQDSPVLRVLFHAGADPGGHLQRQKICVLLHVSMGNQIPLKGRCMPEGEDGVCVAEVVIPFNWWPSIFPPNKNIQIDVINKVPQRFVQVSYSVFEPPLRNPEMCEPKVQIQPLTTFAQVPLLAASTTFKELRADDFLTILMPQNVIYPMAKMHVPVYLRQTRDQKIIAFTMRARVKSGIKILGATTSSDIWNVSIEKENPKHTMARVTAFRKESNGSMEQKNESDLIKDQDSFFEVFSWLLEIASDMKEVLDGGKIVWSVSYVFNNAKVKDAMPDAQTVDDTKKRLIAKLEVNKDDIQAVLPMAKNWELMNTAVLTGRQVAQAMKVFIVSQAGKIADVTLQSSCHAEDESVIKVSSSCSSVYVDGSEIRGSSNASIIVKYGTYVGIAKFIVWMPEFPLEVYIADFRLSQIKGWKIVDDSHYLHKQSHRRKKRSMVWGQQSTNFHNTVGMDKVACRARYQQSPVEVYARFLAVDQNSGRISYFISRRTGLRVSDLVQPLLRVADPKIASLKGRILQGKSMGRTDVQVLSPITGRVIGAKEIRVGSDKVNLSKLIVRVVSGLQLTIIPDNSIENGYIAETSVTHKLTAQYQEGLLDIDLEFSDGSRTPLRDVSVEDYFLLVESLDTEVVAFAPMLASHHPRVIAVGEGNGNLLRVTLLLSEECRMRRNAVSVKQVKSNVTPLASALASVEVDFNNNDSTNKHEPVQNDGIGGRDRKGYHSNGDLADIIIGIPLRDSAQNPGQAIQSKQHRGSIYSMSKLNSNKKGVHDNMSSMEIGMYVLLTAFCFAIIVFVISCVVYASKFRPISVETGLDPHDISKGSFNTNILLRDVRAQKETTTNAHDWVWLGRSTMDKSSAQELTSENAADSRIRITSNPIINYANCNKTNKNFTSFNVKSEGFNSMNYKIAPSDNSLMHSNIDYRPPVPPHRNIGVRALVNNDVDRSHAINPKHTSTGQKIIDKLHKQNENACSSRFEKPQEIHHGENSVTFNENLEKRKIFQLSPEQVFSPHEMTSPSNNKHDKYKNQEIHNAERLVESNGHQSKSAFQFDSLTPRHFVRFPEATKGNDEHRIKKSTNNKGEELHPSVNETANLRKSRIKRAAVVGNPMFSSATGNETGTEESLGLDDLDMNYEQIMHYFDNLKESNA